MLDKADRLCYTISTMKSDITKVKLDRNMKRMRYWIFNPLTGAFVTTTTKRSIAEARCKQDCIAVFGLAV